MDAIALSEHFHRYFELTLAQSDGLLAEVQRLRYRVYCEEFGYEDKSRFPDGRERDPYDDHAIHGLITHKSSGKAVACLRLIPASSSGPLPFEVHARGSFEEDVLASMPRSTYCEISRLCVDREFRRRPGESASPFGNYEKIDLSPKERRLLPFIGISIMLAGPALAFLANRRNIFAMMEPFLSESMKKIGFHFRQVGQLVDYHRPRALYYNRSESMYRLMRPELKDLFHSLYAQLQPYFSSAPVRPVMEEPATHSA